MLKMILNTHSSSKYSRTEIHTSDNRASGMINRSYLVLR